MLRLTEDAAKRWLHGQGLAVPRGAVTATAHEAEIAGADFPQGAVVKALVPTGRRGKAGAVRFARDAGECRAIAQELLGTTVNGHAVSSVYVEERIDLRLEYYLGFVLQGAAPEVLISRSGGIEIEEVARARPEEIVRHRLDPRKGLDAWTATELWLRAGLHGTSLARVAALTVQLHDAFRRADALLLEINPLALDESGTPHLVGAMLAVDPNALFRHPEWRDALEPLPDNPRERAVVLADRAHPGGECQYVELDGDIGLLVGGGGAGLYQHDLVLEAGGRPANHCVTPPTGSDNRKLKAVVSAILDNPGLRALLLGFNFAQMARTDIRVRTLIEVLEEKKIDTARLPIVIRLFGAGEADSRAMAARWPNVHYVPRGTSLKEAVRLVVRLAAANPGTSP